jgi:hypothetical protein
MLAGLEEVASTIIGPKYAKYASQFNKRAIELLMRPSIDRQLNVQDSILLLWVGEWPCSGSETRLNYLYNITKITYNQCINIITQK